jgi:hypothetical protein
MNDKAKTNWKDEEHIKLQNERNGLNMTQVNSAVPWYGTVAEVSSTDGLGFTHLATADQCPGGTRKNKIKIPKK